MCGIAGFVSSKPLDRARAIVERMNGEIAHRGPDDFGYFQDEFVALGHRRLSIIDVSSHGHQPMTNTARSHWIVYNGEVFNHNAVRPELEHLGCQYIGRSDTETILHAATQWGAKCVEKFRGMFAFTVWDAHSRTLLCARDRLGIKPFYYYFDGSVFVFASEIKALLEHPAIQARFEESTINEYLAFGYLSGEKTMFRGIRKLMPGHTASVQLQGDRLELKIQQYWDQTKPATSGEEISEVEWVRETRRRLEETVQMRLMSDVPLGLFLSGGVDSSAIAALVKKMAHGPVKTFSVGYAEERYSELGYAAQVAKAIGTEHHEVRLSREEFFENLPRLIWHEDEPIVWPSSVSLYFVSKLAASQVKVVLTGEGSDELFGGYERYRWNLLNTQYLGAYKAVPAPVRRWIRNQVATSSLLNASIRRKLGHTFVGREESTESLFLDNFYSAYSEKQQRQLMNNAPAHIYDNYLAYDRHWQDQSHLRRMLYADQKTYLVELLMKQDQMSMACSIESRVPFLDHTFVEFAMRAPDSLKIKGTTQKYLFKKSVEDLLPHDIVHRKKMGFPTPLRDWLLEPGVNPIYDALTDKNGFLAEYMNVAELNGLITRHRSGFEDATDRMWRLLNLQLWGDIFITGRREKWWNGVTESAAPLAR